MLVPGNPNDKVLYGRPNKRRSASFPAPRSLDRRHSLRIFGSSSKYLQRCASTRSLHHKHANTTDSSSSTDYPPSVESASPSKYLIALPPFYLLSTQNNPRRCHLGSMMLSSV